MSESIQNMFLTRMMINTCKYLLLNMLRNCLVSRDDLIKDR